ncbi:MAG: ribonuclease E inhibitor RraB [Erysipelotrichaceae bacterium]
MKKLIPALAVLGSAVAFAIYKLKKDEQHKIMELDQDLLEDEDCCCGETCSCEDECTCQQDEPCEVKEEATYSNPEYPNLSDEMMDKIKEKNEETINDLAAEGDVNKNERPIQHVVSFKNKEDLEMFRNKLINKGFVISEGVNDLELEVLHISDIDAVKMMSHVLYIADEAYACHGSYKGWQTKVTY